MATNKKNFKGGLLKSNFQLSIKQLIFFAVVFAAVGGYLIWRSFAATLSLATVGANSMKYSASSTSVTADSTASSGYKLGMYWNGTASGTISSSSAITSISIRAKGDQCNGAPSMTLVVDGVALRTWNVDSAVWANYNYAVSVKLEPSGTHSFSIKFANDYGIPSTCDRNLILDSITFFGTDTTNTALPKLGYYNYTSQSSNNLVFQSQDSLPGIGTQYVSDVAPGGELSYVMSGKVSIKSICYDARAYNSPKSLVQVPSVYTTFVGQGNTVAVDLPTDGNYYQVCVPSGTKTTPTYNVANLSDSAYVLVYQATVKY
jgi:hypothetical protein